MQPIITLKGKVRKGKQRGRALGYPTANLASHKDIPEGIYAAKVKYNHKHFIAATFVGIAETFNEKESFIESYLIDFGEEIYDKWITVRLYKLLRKNKKFHSVEDLVFQMKQDVLDVRSFFSSF